MDLKQKLMPWNKKNAKTYIFPFILCIFAHVILIIN